MMEITAEIRALIDKAAAGVELAGDEYIDPADGLIHCKKCGGQRQTVVPCFGKPGYFMPRCICQCQDVYKRQDLSFGPQNGPLKAYRPLK